MKLRDIAELVRVRRPAAPYGERSLARCHSIDDLAAAAGRRLPAAALGYLDGGGEDEYTLRRNRTAFDAFEIVPRLMRDVHRVDMSTTVLGQRLPLPIVLAPVGAPGLLHPDAELAAARAAQRHGIPFGVSTLASTALEEVARATTAPLWFGLYVWGDRGAARELIARAKAAGYRTLIVTADVTLRSKRERELHAGVTLPTPSLRLSTLLDGARHPRWSWRFLTSAAPTFPNVPSSNGNRSIEHLFDGTLTWRDIEWIRDEWDDTLVIKGVLAVDDARMAVGVGADGVIVSNHGGRQLDHVPAAIDALPHIASAVGSEIEVLFDSGIRRGTDILVALSLGARAVLVGRAYLYGLAAAGEAGVAHAIDTLADELGRAMGLAGCTSLAELHDVDRAGIGPQIAVREQRRWGD